ncbi:MAG: hypothetical protein HW412_119 [Bacteroidetes bacterium]|nr:hypothetical protein [Bacteroidota bacterium]
MGASTDDSATAVNSPAQRTESTTWRIALFVFIVSSTLWLGGSHIRAIIGNDLLKFATLEFEEYIPPDAEREIFRLISFASLAIMISYSAALVSSIVFLMKCPFKLKEHGWLMMSAILFYLFVPVEAFTTYLDSKMIYSEFFTTADNEAFRELFLARLGALAGTPFIATICYYTIIGLAIFQPLKKKPHEA